MNWLTSRIFDGYPVSAAISLRGNDAKTEWVRMADELGFVKVAQLTQVHGNRVTCAADLTHPPYEKADALITNTDGLLLMVRVADCAPVFLFDPISKAIGLVHAGWRGLVSGIISSAVSAMKKEFGSEHSSLLVFIGPSLGPCCAEFSNPGDEIPGRFHPFIQEGKRVDLWAIIHDELNRCAIKEGNVEFVRTCTACNQDEYYSHRMQDSERMGAFLGLTS